jgi:hypothetical protein
MQGFERMDRQLSDAAALAGHLVPAGSMFAFLAAHRADVFPDADYADLFAPVPLQINRVVSDLGLYDQLRRSVVLVDHAVEYLAPPDRQIQRWAGLAVQIGRSLLARLVRAVPVVMAGVLPEDRPQVRR